jgi:hypothetical protein
MTIRISSLPDLRDAQQAARDMCRSLTLDEPDVFDAVVAVTELANHRFIGPQRSGRMGLAVIRSKSSIGLEISAEDDDAPACPGDRPSRSTSRLTFPRSPGR